MFYWKSNTSGGGKVWSKQITLINSTLCLSLVSENKSSEFGRSDVKKQEISS